MGGYRSGQTGQTVNLLALRLRRFESCSTHLETKFADIAQSVERIHGKDEVPGSIPGVGSKQICHLDTSVFLSIYMSAFELKQL